MTTSAFSKMRLAEQHGPVLGGRDLAEEIKSDLARRTGSGETVVVDFEGVVAVTPSFADEFFAKLPSTVVQHVEFINVSSDLQAVAEMARAGRPGSGSDSSR